MYVSQEHIDDVLKRFTIDIERKKISATDLIGDVAMPNLFSFRFFADHQKQSLSNVISEINKIGQNLQLSIHKEVALKLNRAVTDDELRKYLKIDVLASQLKIYWNVERMETDQECIIRLVHQLKQRRLKKEDTDESIKLKKEEQADFAEYKRLKRKYEYGVDQLLQEI